MKALHVMISGRVQGVGYRDWLAAAALARGLDGWVRNRTDGRVEAMLAGAADAVDAVLAACHDGPRAARVTAVTAEPAGSIGGHWFPAAADDLNRRGNQMADRLFIGTRRYSSWSLRGWLAVRLARLGVEEIVIPLAGGTTPAVRAVSPGGTVPYLEHAGNRIWESLAICEYCAEQAPGLWPDSPAARAHARVIAAEMHAGFRELRTAMPMSLFLSGAAGTGGSAAVLEDIARIEAIWRETRKRFGAGGPFLFGRHFTLADAMYAPVVARFLTYEPKLKAGSRGYCNAVRAHELVAAWYEAAAAEPAEWHIARYETAP